MSRDLTARLVIGGDASGAKQALSSLEAQMNAVERAGGRLQAAGGALMGFGGGALAKGGLAAGVLTPFVKGFMDAEQSATEMQLAFMEAGGKINGVFEAIDKKSEALSNVMPGSKTDTDQTARWLMQLGTAPEIIRDGALEASTALRVLFKMSNEEAAKTGVAMSQAFSLSGAEFTKGADLFQRANFGLGISAGEYTQALTNAGAMLKTLNIKGISGMQDATVLLGLMKQGQLSGGEAGTSLNAMLKGAAQFKDKVKSDSELSGLLRKNGLLDVNFVNEKGQIDPKNLAFQMEKFKKLNDADRVVIFDKMFGDGARAASAIAEGGVEGWNKIVDKLSQQATLQQRLDKIIGTLGSKWESALGNVGTLVKEIGAVFEVELKGGADSVAQMAQDAAEFVRSHKEWIKYIGYGVSGYAAMKLSAGAISLVGGGALSFGGRQMQRAGWLANRLGWKGLGDKLAPPGKSEAGPLGAGLNVTPVRVVNWNEFGGKGAPNPANTNPANQFDPKKAPAPANGNAPGALEMDPKKPSLMRRAAGGLSRAGRYGGGLALAGLAGTALFSTGASAAEGALANIGGASQETMGMLQMLGGGGVMGKFGGAAALLGKFVKPADWALKAWDFGQAAKTGDVAQMGASGGNIGGGMAGAMAGAAIGSIVPVIGTLIGGAIGGIAGSFGGEKLGGFLGEKLQGWLGGTPAGKPDAAADPSAPGLGGRLLGWGRSLFGGGKTPDLSLPKTPALTEIVSREGIRPGPGMGAAQVTAPISITVNANGASPEVAAQVAKAVQDQSADIVRMITDHFERQRRVAM